MYSINLSGAAYERLYPYVKSYTYAYLILMSRLPQIKHCSFYFCCSDIQSMKINGESGFELSGNLQSSTEKVKLSTIKTGIPKIQLELAMPFEIWIFLEKYYEKNLKMALNGIEPTIKRSETEKVLLICENLSNLERSNLETLPEKHDIRLAYACISDQWSQDKLAILTGWLSWNSKILVMKHKESDDGKGNHCIIGKSHDVLQAIAKLKSANFALEKNRNIADLLRNSTTDRKNVIDLRLKILETRLTTVPLIIAEPHLLYFHKMSCSNNSLVIICLEDNLLKQEVDMIICSSSTTPQFSKGLARKIKDALMYDIEADMQNVCIKSTENIVVEAHKLKCKRVMFVAMPYMKECKSDQDGQRKLTMTIINCLNRADELKASSIAMPAIGTGQQQKSIKTLVLLIFYNYMIVIIIKLRQDFMTWQFVALITSEAILILRLHTYMY